MKHIFLWQQFKQLDIAHTLRRYQLETCDEVADELISSLSDYEVCVNGTKQAFNKVKQDIQNRINERTDRVGSFNMYIDIMNIDIDTRIGNRTLWEWSKAMDKIDKVDKLEEFLLKYKREFHKTYFKTIFESVSSKGEKAMCIDDSAEMIYNIELYYCVEVSGIIEHYFKKHNAFPMPNTIASKILQVDEDQIILSKKDNIHYDRFFGQDRDRFTKMICGLKSEEIFQEVMSDFEDNYDFMKEVNKMVNESKETKYSVRQAIYIIENLYRMHEENGLNELIPKWHDALRDSMEVLNSTEERTQTISDYIEYGEYLLSDMQVLTLNVISLTTIEYGKHTNHDETPSHIHTEPLCEIARINVCESGNGLFPYNTWELKMYSNDHTPPHFHVIADGWDVSFKIDNGELLVVNRKGRNDTIYQYMMDNIPKWLEANCAVLPIATNKQNANAVWKQIHTMTDDFSSKHRIDEMATISRPADNFPRQSKVIVYGENDEQGTNTPHFHVQIDNGAIELEIKFEHIRTMEIWRTKDNYPKSWDGITDVRDRIIEWFDEVSEKNFGVSNLKRMIMAWNDGNPTNEIDEQFTE